MPDDSQPAVPGTRRALTDLRRFAVSNQLVVAAKTYHETLLSDFNTKYEGAPNYSNEDDVFLTRQLEAVETFMRDVLCVDTDGNEI